MSIADAVRTRELEARVAALEKRVAVLEKPPIPSEPSPAAMAFVKNLERAKTSKPNDAA